jgi:hypothetical protein
LSDVGGEGKDKDESCDICVSCIATYIIYLKRRFKLRDLLAYGVGMILGAGIYALIGKGQSLPEMVCGYHSYLEL